MSTVLPSKLQGKRCRCNRGNIKIVLREIGCRLGSISRREHQMIVLGHKNEMRSHYIVKCFSLILLMYHYSTKSSSTLKLLSQISKFRQ